MIWKIRNSWFIYLHHVKNCYCLQNKRDLAWDFLHRVEIRIISLTLSTNHLFSSKKIFNQEKQFSPYFQRGRSNFWLRNTKTKKFMKLYYSCFSRSFLKNSWNNSIILCKSAIFTLCWHFCVSLFEDYRPKFNLGM